MSRVKNRSQQLQKYMNCTSNCFWPPASTGCLQTSKEYFRERDLAPMKKRYRKQWHILCPKTNRSTIKSIELLGKRSNQRIPRKETVLKNRAEFCLKVVGLLVRLRNYSVICYIHIVLSKRKEKYIEMDEKHLIN